MSVRALGLSLAVVVIAGCGTNGAPDGGVALDAAGIDGGGRDVGVDAADAAAVDAYALDAYSVDTSTIDAGADANACGFIGAPCNSSGVSAPDCPFGFVCYGGHWSDDRATGVCLSAVGPRTDCSGTHLCPGSFGGAGTRCYLPYGLCLYSYEVPCVCDDPAAASNCGPPS
jgi:hypothetical protein